MAMQTFRKSMYSVARNLAATRNMSSAAAPKVADLSKFETLAVSTPKPHVFHVELNRASKFNSLNKTMWCELKDCFESLEASSDCRVVVVSGAGKHFCSGIDLNDMMKLAQELSEIEDVARKGVLFDRAIKLYQDSLSSLEVCRKPVISAIHMACIGAGVDLISAADIRYCSQDAFFQVKEVDIGMAPDVGTLQRLPKAIGSQSLVRELCFTGRRFESNEAKENGFISKVFPDKDSLLEGAISLAETIAEKSPVAVQGTKDNMIYSFNKTNQEGLDHIRYINKLHLQSEDFGNAIAAQLTKGEKPVFSKF